MALGDPVSSWKSKALSLPSKRGKEEAQQLALVLPSTPIHRARKRRAGAFIESSKGGYPTNALHREGVGVQHQLSLQTVLLCSLQD